MKFFALALLIASQSAFANYTILGSQASQVVKALVESYVETDILAQDRASIYTRGIVCLDAVARRAATCSSADGVLKNPELFIRVMKKAGVSPVRNAEVIYSAGELQCTWRMVYNGTGNAARDYKGAKCVIAL